MRSRILRSNLCHAADSYGQVRVCWSANATLGLQPITFAPDDEIRHVATFGPWPAPLRHDGRPFAIRVGIALHVDAGAVDVYAFLGRPRPERTLSSFTALGGAADSWTGETATSAAWIADARLLRMSAGQARECIATTATIDHDGDPAAVEQCLVALHLYASGTAGTLSIDGVSAAEWQGDVE
ncbi:hypothetical protein DB32_006044 [Sandaracinus amylolyticus]|uniref:Uncharacterized protein n=1 Tax=Sandaracinus amylolyticus TaxID=927083 RepID=A0A0F6YM05_9BACT|nr:hypothetical protein DB32_006044 [Sandaracinus amylolyticus]